ncbi:hypothetical protein RFI_37847, partial [Reticulomyxa filosa]
LQTNNNNGICLSVLVQRKKTIRIWKIEIAKQFIIFNEHMQVQFFIELLQSLRREKTWIKFVVLVRIFVSNNILIKIFCNDYDKFGNKSNFFK